MRWVVELPASSGGTAATVTVDSDSWAGALSSARGGVSIRKFRCEFENDGVVRVNDLEANERYTVRPYRAAVAPAVDAAADATAPDLLRGVTIPPASGRPSRSPTPPYPSGGFAIAPPPGTTVALSPPNSAPPASAAAPDGAGFIEFPASLPGTVAMAEQPNPVEDAVAAASASPEAAPEPAAQPPVAESAVAPATFAPTVVDLPIFVAPTPPPNATSGPSAIPVPESNPNADHGTDSGDGAAVTSSLLFERDQDPSATNPLTYRERVFSVAEGTTVAQAESIARHSLTMLKRSLATRPRGRYVTIAVFDHVFVDRPTQSPLVVLRWKDWRSEVAELLVRPAVTASPAAAIAPAASVGSTPASLVATPAVIVTPAAPPAVAVALPAPAEPAPPGSTPVEPPSAPAAAPATSSAEFEPPSPAVEVTSVVEAVPAPAVESAAPRANAEAPVVVAESTTPLTTVVEPALADPAAPSPAPAVVASAVGEGEISVDQSAPLSSDAGGRRKKRRGRRDSQPSLPTTEPSTPILAAPAETPPASVTRTRFPGGRRGPDLLSDLFDAMMELSLLHTGDEVCAFVTDMLTQHLQCDAVLVFGYDINRDEFEVHGEANTSRLAERIRAKAASFGAATRAKRTLSIAQARGDDRADEACEGGPAVFAPAMHHERLFALVQLARLPGSAAFEADEVDAITYVAGQLAEALALHSLRQTSTDLIGQKEPVKGDSRRPR